MWILIKRTINYYFKSSKEFIFLFIFPIVIMTAQYMMMENIFKSSNDNLYRDIKVYYEIKNDGIISEDILKGILKPLNGEKGNIGDINEHTALLQIDGEKIKIIYGSLAEKTVDYVVNIINSYTRASIVMEKADGLNNNVNVTTDYIKAMKKPESKDYYGVSMMSIFLITVGSMCTGLISKDKIKGMKNRLTTIGVNNFRYYISTMVGFVLIATIGLLPCYIYSYFVLKTNWGGNLIIPYLALIPFFILFISIFMLVTAIFENGEKVMGMVGGIAFPVLGGLGGAFFPVESFVPKWFNSICYISPLKWYNDGIFNMVYQGEYKALIIAVVVATLLGAIFTGITIIYSNRKERIA